MEDTSLLMIDRASVCSTGQDDSTQAVVGEYLTADGLHITLEPQEACDDGHLLVVELQDICVLQ